MKLHLKTLLTTLLFPIFLFAQEANITIDLGIKKYVGTISEFDHSKYFGIQSSVTSSELKEESTYLFDKLGASPSVSMNGPEPYGNLENISANKIGESGESVRSEFSGSPIFKKYGKKNSFILSQKANKVFKMNSDADEASKKINAYFSDVLLLKPNDLYVLMEEPFSNTALFAEDANLVKRAMSNYYKNVAVSLKKEHPKIQCGGPSLARPRFETQDFENWEKSQKLFMDIAGEQVDFFSLKLYDSVDRDTSTIDYCSGSNIEATLDLIETYSFKKFDKVKPMVVSEYGLKVPYWEGTKYSDDRNAFTLESLNKIVMALMDKPDRIAKAVPFIFGKKENFYENMTKNPNGYPHPFAVLKKNEDGTYGYTDLVKFYEFWKDIKGNRTYIASDNPDVQVNAFLDNGKWQMIFNNLSDKTQSLNLNFSEFDASQITKYTLRRLFLNEKGLPELTEAFTDIHIDQWDIDPNETLMLICDVPKDLKFATSIVEYNNYSKDVLKPIVADEPIKFTINNVKEGKGKAFVRLSFGRDIKKDLKPIVKVNGNIVLTPDNWGGYDQANKVSFFGMLSIPIPMSYLKKDNEVEVTFADTGGKVSSVVINTEIFSTDVENKNYENPTALVYATHGGNLLHVSNKIKCKAPKIVDTEGNVIKKLKSYENGETVDISTLKSGTYFLDTTTDGKIKFKK